MKIINGILYAMSVGVLGYWLIKRKESNPGTVSLFMEKHVYIWVLLIVVNTVSFSMNFVQSAESLYIQKDTYGGVEQEIPIELQKGEEHKQIVLDVSPRKLTQKQTEKKMQEAFAFLEKHIQAENESLQSVKSNLDFSLDYEQFPFDVEVSPADYSLLDAAGTVKNEEKQLLALGYSKEEIEKGILTEVKIALWYEEINQEQTYTVTMFAKDKEGIEKVFQEVEDLLQSKEQEAAYEEGFYLPVSENGVEITRTDEAKISPGAVLVMGLILIGLLLLRERENQKKLELEKRENLRRSYPWFVNEMVLLLGAGMQVRNIFGVLIKEAEGGKDMADYRKPLIEELRMAVHSMELGVAEEQAYFQLGRRLQLPCYIKLLTLLEQNVKRGTKGLTMLFEQEELAALEERKNLAKRYGEEAGTKLLGPMILLLLVIMLMNMVPAFMSIM